VPLDSPISITFDDKMNRRSVEGAFFVTPPTDMGSLTWEDRAVKLTTAEGLVEDKTYTVLLGLGMEDRRGNKMKEPVLVHFSTGDSVAPGVVRGKVETGQARVPSVMVWAYPSESCPPELGVTVPDGVGQAGAKGEFFVGGLDTRGTYCVYAHLDRDGDNDLDENDLFIGADSTVVFVPDSSVVSGVTIYLVPDDEPGAITGAVVDSAGPDSLDIASVVLTPATAAPDSGLSGVGDPEGTTRGERAPAEGAAPRGETLAPDSILIPVVSDSAAAPASAEAPVDTMELKRSIAATMYSAAKIIVLAVDVADSANYAQAEVTKPGPFSLKGLSPGVYRLTAFRDLNGDKEMSVGREPVARLEGVAVGPGRTTDAGELILRRRPEEVKDD
jgi:uncharacterized protein (DUF2141 family)